MSQGFLFAGAIAIAALAAPLSAQGTAPAGAAQANPTRAAVLKTLDENFKSVDANGDGALSQAELATAEGKVIQQRLAQVRSRFEAEFGKLDTNKDGTLSKTEFMAAAPQAPATVPNGANTLAQFDSNKDGKVTEAEYRTPVLARFDRADTNKDGTLSLAERQAAAKAEAGAGGRR
ncbi:MAG: EF-hand domain-containing protein [Sphingomicrobium sp.]